METRSWIGSDVSDFSSELVLRAFLHTPWELAYALWDHLVPVLPGFVEKSTAGEIGELRKFHRSHFELEPSFLDIVYPCVREKFPRVGDQKVQLLLDRLAQGGANERALLISMWLEAAAIFEHIAREHSVEAV